MPNREQPQVSGQSQSDRPRVVNPQLAQAPGEDALEAAAEVAGPIASVQRHEIE